MLARLIIPKGPAAKDPDQLVSLLHERAADGAVPVRLAVEEDAVVGHSQGVPHVISLFLWISAGEVRCRHLQAPKQHWVSDESRMPALRRRAVAKVQLDADLVHAGGK